MKLMEPEILLSEIKTKKLAVSFTQAKRSQHFNAPYRSILGRNTLDAFGHSELVQHVATC